MQKGLFFFCVIVLAFIPGGIFISVFLLALYYLVPLFLEQNNKKQDTPEFTVHFQLVENKNSDPEDPNMKSFSKDTLEEMK